MKNILCIGLLLSLFMAQACVKDEDKVFDASAAERMNAAIAAHKTALTAAVNGWAVEYYPETDHSMGGYNFVWKFNDDGTVAIAGERPAADSYQAAGKTEVSDYNVIKEEGSVLTFNTYNEVLHAFVEPFGPSDVDGYAGDYEFVIREVTPEQIVMTGKKYGSTLLLKPYTGGDASTWKAYVEGFETQNEKMRAPVYEVKVNGTAVADIAVVTRRYRAFRFTYTNPENNKIVPYITTPTGIKLFEPLTINGKTAQYFTFDEAGKKLVSEEEGNSFVIELGTFATNTFLANLDTWGYVDYGQSSKSVKELLNTCATNIYDAYEESLYWIAAGASMFADRGYPGHGFIFISRDRAKDYWYAQFLYDFIPEGDNLKITYTGRYAIHASYYTAHYAAFLTAITDHSPYRVEVYDPVSLTEIVVTSVADPTFYFVLNDFGQ